jgi:septal ring factor EnvC (AmiA/AmiB activator)
MSAADTDLILQALKEHREETRQDLHELRAATVKVADAAAEMGKAMARSEERHAQHEDAVKRMGRELDDHEQRIRDLEASQPDGEVIRATAEKVESIRDQLLTSRGNVSGGWKVLTILGALCVGIAGIATALIQAVSS